MTRLASHSSRHALRQTIRKVGLRGTSPRIAVLQLLENATMPLSHTEVCDALMEQGFDKATLYRNLTDLTEAGLLSRLDVGDHVWRFELRHREQGQAGNHPHFVCIVCGNVYCLPGVRVRITPKSQFQYALNTGAVIIQFRGSCDQCAA